MTSDTRKDKRARVPGLTVRYKSATNDEFIDNQSLDVSVGGVFVKTQTPFAPGTLLKLEIIVAGESSSLTGVGRVVWKREPTQAAAERPAGMGVKFIKIDDVSRQTIDRLVTAALAAPPAEPTAAAPLPKPSAPPPRAVTPAPPPARAALKGTVPWDPSPAAEPLPPPPPPADEAPVESRRRAGVPLGLASQLNKTSEMPVPVAAPTQPFGALTFGTDTPGSSDDEFFANLEQPREREPVGYPSPFDPDPPTMIALPKAGPDESQGFSSTLPLSRDALPDFAAAEAAKKAELRELEATRPIVGTDFASTLPLDRSKLFPDDPPVSAKPMFPVDGPRKPQNALERAEPTVMKQAAELLEEALREAGGSMDEVQANPLYTVAGGLPSGPAPSLGGTDDLLASIRGAEPAERASLPGAAPAVPAYEPAEPRASQVVPLQMASTPAPPPVAELAMASAGQQVMPLPEPKKRGGGALIGAVVAVALLAGGGIFAYKAHLFGGAPPATSASVAPLPSAAPSEAPSAAAAPSASASAATGEDAAPAVDAAPAAPASAAASAAVPVVAPSAPVAPKPAVAPVAPKPAEPKPAAPVEPKPAEPKPAEPAEPKPAEPKPAETAAPKPVEPKPVEPKPAEPAPKPVEPAPKPAAPVEP
jgi:uncharacterized protein (TIGR02266 family)